MREKKLQLIISFDSTTHAMAVEQYCLKNGIPGRLIPLPKEISAGCGLAWKSRIEDMEILIASFENGRISYDGMYELLI